MVFCFPIVVLEQEKIKMKFVVELEQMERNENHVFKRADSDYFGDFFV